MMQFSKHTKKKGLEVKFNQNQVEKLFSLTKQLMVAKSSSNTSKKTHEKKPQLLVRLVGVMYTID